MRPRSAVQWMAWALLHLASGWSLLVTLAFLRLEGHPYWFAGDHRSLNGHRRLGVDAGLLGRGVRGGGAGHEVIKPGAGLIAERAPEVPQRPVTGGVAAEEGHLQLVPGHIGVRDALLGEEQVVLVIVVDQH